MDISRSGSPNTRQLIIEGETVTIPADPVPSFRSIRTQTLASYRAIVSGTSTARDHALIFGIVTAADTSDTQGAAEGITIPDTANPRRSSEHQRSKRPRPDLPARGPELSQRYWAMKKGFIGDFTDPWEANTKTSMSLTWVKGTYVEGTISFGGMFARSEIQVERCKQCVRDGLERVCRQLVDAGKEDVFIGFNAKCGHCTQKGGSCSLYDRWKKQHGRM